MAAAAQWINPRIGKKEEQTLDSSDFIIWISEDNNAVSPIIETMTLEWIAQIF